MKTNEMSLQEMQQTNGGAGMPPMPDNSGAGDLTIRQAGPSVPVDGSAPTDTMFDGWQSRLEGMDPGSMTM